MTELLRIVASWPSLLLVVLVFGFAPGFCLRLLVLAYPCNDPRRTELIAELYTVPRIQRPLWVAEQLETALFEGVPHRLMAVFQWAARPHRARAKALLGAVLLVGLGVGLVAVLGVGLGIGVWVGLVAGLIAWLIGIGDGFDAELLVVGLVVGVWVGLVVGLVAVLVVGLVVGLRAIPGPVFGTVPGAFLGAGLGAVLGAIQGQQRRVRKPS